MGAEPPDKPADSPTEADLPTSVPLDGPDVPPLDAAQLGSLQPVPSTSGLAHIEHGGSTARARSPTRIDSPDAAPEELIDEPDTDSSEDERDGTPPPAEKGSPILDTQLHEAASTAIDQRVAAGSPPSSESDGLNERQHEVTQVGNNILGTSESSDGDHDEEDEDEEEEPTLKYQRFLGDTLDLLKRESVSALAVSSKYIVLGMHSGGISVLDHQGKTIKRYRAHTAMINDISIDQSCDFVASASMDGRVFVQSLSGTDQYLFDMRRPMRCVSLDPSFGKRNTMQVVSGGMAGNLVLHEKGWLGHKETILHSGEGPIGAVEWRGSLIAWANDAGVRIYDTTSGQRITYISRAGNSPRADLFPCSLYWQDDQTLLIAWADFIKIAVVKEREGKRANLGVGPHVTELFVEVTSIFQVDCMISGIAPYGDSYLILAYLTEEVFGNEATDDPFEQRRKAASRPELRIISTDGEELSSDAIGLRSYDRYHCRDYSLCPSPTGDSFYVISPQDIVVARTRDDIDHVTWLIERERYKEALKALEDHGLAARGNFNVSDVGRSYLEYLLERGEYDEAAKACPSVFGINAKLWEDWIFLYADRGHLPSIIPYVPIHDPQLSRLVYEMILVHHLRHDEQAMLRTVKTWPADIYDVPAVILAVRGRLDRKRDSTTLKEALAELYILNRQPGKALPFLLQLRRAGAFDLIRQYNLFTDIQDQVLQLIEFDRDLRKQQPRETPQMGAHEEDKVHAHGDAIALLVEHTHSIPIPRVVSQLQQHRQYLFMYLDALFDRDPHLAFDYSDLQVNLYAEFNPNKLMEYLRASTYYSLEQAYEVCDKHDLVPEMVFLLGRMGDNKRALNLIIDRLGDVQRAIDFAKEQDDEDLWEDLLQYSETRPRFIRGLLNNAGPEIDPIRLVRRIRNGLEIPGLKAALIKVLQDFNLQVSLMEGCKSILYSDCRQLALQLHNAQTNGFLWTGETADRSGGEAIFPHLSGGGVPTTLPFGVRYLCGDTYSSKTVFPAIEQKSSFGLAESVLVESSVLARSGDFSRAMADKIDFIEVLRGSVSGDESKGCRACSTAVEV